MKTTTLFIATAFALGALAGCDRKAPEQRTPATPPSSQAGTGGTSTPNTPANIGQAQGQEKKDGANPVQGQVDPKQGEQNRDFHQPGDGAGPKSPDTKTGG
jgi:hypothetical protein